MALRRRPGLKIVETEPTVDEAKLAVAKKLGISPHFLTVAGMKVHKEIIDIEFAIDFRMCPN